MASCRFAVAIHALVMLAYKRGQEVTSEYLARSINTNAVVVRRLLGDLREAGLVKTQKGATGGATLNRTPEEISLRAVYEAVECGPPLALPVQAPNPACPVGRKMEEVLPQIFARAQEAMTAELEKRTLADLVDAEEASQASC